MVSSGNNLTDGKINDENLKKTMKKVKKKEFADKIQVDVIFIFAIIIILLCIRCVANRAG
jgi:hypothetical protein